MATFYQDPNPTSDPDYAKASKEPERVQANTSLGTLFSGIGDITKDTGAAFGTIFDTAIKKDAQDIVNPIRNAAGAGLDYSTVQDIAGTGAKGRVRALQMRNGAGNIDDPTDAGPLGFAPADASLVQTQTAGIFAGVDQPKKQLPDDAQLEIGQLTRMQTAYRSGQLSDSAYSASLIAGAQKLKARYPGFEDEVDSAFEKITGQNSANSIRKSLMQDIQYNQMAQLSAQSDDQKFRTKYREVAAGLGLDPDNTPMEQLRPAVNKELGAKYNFNSRKQEAEVGSVEAEQTLSDTVAHQARTSLVALGNRAQGQKGLGDFVKEAQEMALKGGGTPKERADLANRMELARQAAELEVRRQAYLPIEGRKDGHTAVSLQGAGGDDKFTKILDNQFNKPWKDAIALVNTGNMSALQQQTDSMKYADNTDLQNFQKAFPQARVAAAINNAFPNNPVFSNRFLEKSDILPKFGAIATSVGNAILGGNAAAPAPTPSQALGAYGPATKEPTQAEIDAGARPWSEAERAQAQKIARQTIKQYDMLVSPDNKNAENSLHVAKQFFKDTDFYDQKLNNSGRLKTFMIMASPAKSAYIDRLAGSDPEVKDLYDHWMKRAAGDIWSRNAADLQSALTDKRLDLVFNPKSGQFVDQTKYDQDVTSASWRTSNQKSVQSINNVMSILRPVVGNNPTAILDALHIDPNEPKAQGILESMAKGIGDKFQEWRESDKREDIRRGSVPSPSIPAGEPREPQQTRGVIKGNLSDSTDTSVESFPIPPGMSPAEYIAKLKSIHQL